MEKSFEDRLYQKQAERITELMHTVQRLEQEKKSLTISAYFYEAMVKAIGDDIMLQDEWKRFIGILRLSNPDIPGITRAESQFK